jgi:hypothetical protein
MSATRGWAAYFALTESCSHWADTPATCTIPANETRSSNTLSMRALVSAEIGFQTGFSTNCRRQSLPANFTCEFWHPLFLTSRLPAILHYYPLRTTRKTGRSPPLISMRPPCLYSRRSSSSGVGRWKNTIHGFIIASGIEKLVGEGCEFLTASRCINSSADTSRKCTSLLAPSCFARDR